MTTLSVGELKNGMTVEATAPLIAIVDDDESFRSAVDSLLRSGGYRSVAFQSGAAFLDCDHKHEIGCLILDISMPGMNGLELQRRLAEMKSSIPIVFVTGHFPEWQETALKQGAFAFLEKTSSGGDLLKVIESALQSGRR
jgi:FixJ family two-component response regulator